MLHIDPTGAQKQPIDQHAIPVTFFPDERAFSKEEENWTLPDLAGEILDRSAARKDLLPFLKLARFGEMRSRKNCLRTNANLREVTGIEIDYDDGTVPFDDAVEMMKAAGIRSLLYTSASYSAGQKEKWRVLVPFSRGYPPGQREGMVAVVNGILGGIAGSESFTLSQSFYYGSVQNNREHRVEVIDGDFVDLRPDLLQGVIGRPARVKTGSTPRPGSASAGVSPGRDKAEILDLIASSRKKNPHGGGQWHNNMLSATASMIGKGWTDEEIYDACEPYCDGQWGDEEIAEMIEDGRAKWNIPNPGKAIDAIGPVVAAAIASSGGKPPAATPLWREIYANGRPKASLHNARLAIIDSHILCREDVFHNEMYMSAGQRNSASGDGEVLSFVGEVTDARLLGLRFWLSDKYSIDLTEKYVRDAVIELARENRFNPVVDMLAEAEAGWDGVERLDRMAADYFNAEDTALNAAFVRKVMIAACARARQPGCKFDNILVMESPEGWNKSSVWALLAGKENFSDERIIGRSTREVQEQLEGVWIHESADLAGMRKAEVETVKAFASRMVDRARPAYGHFLVKQPRHSIEVGTTNADSYLQSQSGNRRFWPMRVLKPIDLDQLKRDRMQLWGEAAHYQSHGESMVLPEALWGVAAEEQEGRRVEHPWEDKLAHLSPVTGVVKEVYNEWRVTTSDLFYHLQIAPADQQRHAKALAEVMKVLGWTRLVFKKDAAAVRGYVKTV